MYINYILWRLLSDSPKVFKNRGLSPNLALTKSQPSDHRCFRGFLKNGLFGPFSNTSQRGQNSEQTHYYSQCRPVLCSIGLSLLSASPRNMRRFPTDVLRVIARLVFLLRASLPAEVGNAARSRAGFLGRSDTSEIPKDFTSHQTYMRFVLR